MKTEVFTADQCQAVKPLRDYIPVSYTHLDVYKRQVKSSLEGPAHEVKLT